MWSCSTDKPISDCHAYQTEVRSKEEYEWSRPQLNEQDDRLRYYHMEHCRHAIEQRIYRTETLSVNLLVGGVMEKERGRGQ
jgi:hypothetical protein